MRPSDCENPMDLGEEQGIKFGDHSIELIPELGVIITSGDQKITLSRRIFDRFARWYFDDQEENIIKRKEYKFNPDNKKIDFIKRNNK